MQNIFKLLLISGLCLFFSTYKSSADKRFENWSEREICSFAEKGNAADQEVKRKKIDCGKLEKISTAISKYTDEHLCLQRLFVHFDSEVLDTSSLKEINREIESRAINDCPSEIKVIPNIAICSGTTRHNCIGDLKLENSQEYYGTIINGYADGYGQLKIKNKGNYEGYFSSGKRHGLGFMNYDDGSKYVGNWANNYKNGYGKLTKKFGNYVSDIYEGNWKNGKRNGYGFGRINFAQYSGNWINDLPDGYGKIKTASGASYIGDWKSGKKNGNGKYKDTLGNTYEGDWYLDNRHGFGEAYFKNRGTYIGEYTKNLRNGKGTFEYRNGSKYEGAWLKDKRHGRGKYIWSDGEYNGEWQNDQPDGMGTITWEESGDKYVGEVKGFSREGFGTYYFKKSGDKIAAEWFNNKREGPGTIYYKNGNEISGTFKNDQMQGPAAAIMSDGKEYALVYKDNEIISQKLKPKYGSKENTCENNVSECTDYYLCKVGSIFKNGVKTWRNGSSWGNVSGYKKYISEAKKRGLTCGVVDANTKIASKTTKPVTKLDKSSNTCKNNLSQCSGSYLCRLGTISKNGVKTWKDVSGYQKYISEAKKRGLTCGVDEINTKTVSKTTKPKVSPKPAQTYGGFSFYNELPKTLFFVGDIAEDDNFELRKALRSHDIKTIVLASPGGSVWEGLTMAGTISDKGLQTYVPEGTVCASACSFMFFAGENRISDGKLGVHQFYSSQGKKNAAIGAVQNATQFTTSEIIGFLNEFDTPPWVFEKMFAQQEMYFFTDPEKRKLEKGKLNRATKEKISEFFSALLKDKRVKSPTIVQKKKKAPEYIFEKVEVFLDPIKAEWEYETLIVTARNDSKHTIISPRIKFRFGNCDGYGPVVVKRVQRKLNDLGHNAGKADGIFGGKTKAAIRNYQKSRNLKATGQIDDTLLRRLNIEKTDDFMEGVTGVALGGIIEPNSTAMIYFDNLGLFTKKKRMCYKILSDVNVKTLKK